MDKKTVKDYGTSFGLKEDVSIEQFKYMRCSTPFADIDLIDLIETVTTHDKEAFVIPTYDFDIATAVVDNITRGGKIGIPR
jgi:hypothetical protein